MLLTRHKLWLLGIGWFVLALLALAGMTAFAEFSTPLPLLPPTQEALAYVSPPTLVPVRPAAHRPATATPTGSRTPAKTAAPTGISTEPLQIMSGSPDGAGIVTAPATNTVRPASPVVTASPTSMPATGLPSATLTAPPTTTPTASRPAPTPTATATQAPASTRTPTATQAPAASATNPPAPGPVPLADFWGINGGPVDGNNSSTPLDGDLSYNAVLRAKSLFWMNRAGIRWFRNYGSDSINYSWRFVEPAPGVYDWTAWDTLVREAQNKNVSLLASIGNGVPAWANGSSDWRVKPLDLYTDPINTSAWYQYVQHVVERYDGDGLNDMPGLTKPVKFWELWNEPDLRDGSKGPAYPAEQFNGTVKDYVRLSQVGYAAIKAADAGAQVVGPATAQSIGNPDRTNWLLWNWGDWMQAGGLNTVDIVAFHAYFDSNNWDASGQIDTLLNRLDASRGGKPVWVTEVGWDGGTTSDYQVKDRNFVRSVVLFWQRPALERYFWYTLQESETYDGSHQKAFLQTLSGGAAKGTEPDPLFHPVFRVAQVMARVLAGFGAGYHPAPIDVGGAARAFRFSRTGVDVWVAWQRGPDGTSSINIDTGGRSVRVVGLAGQDLGTFAGGALTVGPTPVYLTTQLDWNPNQGTITGRVSNGGQAGQWGNGLNGVTVNLAGAVNASTTTDSDGNYIFEGLPDGAYTVSIEGHNASPASQTVTVAAEAAWGRTSFSATP